MRQRSVTVGRVCSLSARYHSAVRSSRSISAVTGKRTESISCSRFTWHPADRSLTQILHTPYTAILPVKLLQTYRFDRVLPAHILASPTLTVQYIEPFAALCNVPGGLCSATLSTCDGLTNSQMGDSSQECCRLSLLFGTRQPIDLPTMSMYCNVLEEEANVSLSKEVCRFEEHSLPRLFCSSSPSNSEYCAGSGSL